MQWVCLFLQLKTEHNQIERFSGTNVTKHLHWHTRTNFHCHCILTAYCFQTNIVCCEYINIQAYFPDGTSEAPDGALSMEIVLIMPLTPNTKKLYSRLPGTMRVFEKKRHLKKTHLGLVAPLKIVILKKVWQLNLTHKYFVYKIQVSGCWKGIIPKFWGSFLLKNTFWFVNFK